MSVYVKTIRLINKTFTNFTRVLIKFDCGKTAGRVMKLKLKWLNQAHFMA